MIKLARMVCVLMSFTALTLFAESALPEGYVPLEWIASTGTQYIDTGLTLQAPSDVVHMKFMPTTIGSGGVLFGNRVTSSVKCFMAHYNSTSAFDININNSSYENNRWRIGNYTVDFGDTKMLEIEAAITGITVKIDDVVCGPMVPKNQDVFETAGNCTILKGVVTGSGGTLPNENGAVGRLYSFSIIRGGEKVLDLVPVKSGDKVGMFDYVSGDFFESEAPESFVAGPMMALPPDMVRLAYITSSGAEYIDTGVTLHTPSDVVRMRFMPTTIGSGGVLFGNRVTATSKCFMAHYNSASAFDININNSSYENNRWRIVNYTTQARFDASRMLEIEAAITGITVKIDDVVCGPMVPKNQDVFETAGNCTILKGVVTGSGGVLPNENGAIGRLYSFSIIRGGERVLDLVPVRSGDKVGMFDFVSGDLLENAGGGAFVAGPEADGELAIAAAPTSFGARSEDAFDPAVGSVFLLTGETKVCRAFPVTDLCGQVGAVPVFYTLEEFDEKLNAYLPPGTNFESVCEYTQGEKYTRVRLTWHWADKTTLRVGAIKNGTMLVNGVPLDDCARRILPPGYVRLDYVESKGQSWVDTKVTLKSPSDRVYMKYTFADDVNDKGGVLFGSRVTVSNRCFTAHYNNCVRSLSVTVDNSDYKNNVLEVYNYESLHNFQGETLEIDASIGSLAIWCNRRNASASRIPTRKDSFETAGTCMLFKGVKPDVEGSVLPNENVAFGRLHAFRILRDGAYIVDLVPVLNSDGVAGLYDFARERFFRSEGTADFQPGPEMSEVYVDQDASVTLTAKGNFRRWVGDVTEAEANSNPLVKHLEGWETITPKISAGIIIVVR